MCVLCPMAVFVFRHVTAAQSSGSGGSKCVAEGAVCGPHPCEVTSSSYLTMCVHVSSAHSWERSTHDADLWLQRVSV